MDLTRSSYSLSLQYDKLLWHIWNEQGNRVRTLTGLQEETPNRLKIDFSGLKRAFQARWSWTIREHVRKNWTAGPAVNSTHRRCAAGSTNCFPKAGFWN